MSQQQQAPTYQFPILAKDDLLQCMADMGVSMSEQDLQKPNPEHIRMIYENFVEILMGFSKEELYQPTFDSLEESEYPELQDESYPRSSFLENFETLLHICGMPDVSINDILNPTYGRTRKILSAIINLAKFREEKLVNFHESNAKAEELSEQRELLEIQVQELQATLSLFKATFAEEEKEAEAIEKECEGSVDAVNSMNKEQAQLNCEIRKIKEDEKENMDILANEKFMTMNLKDEKAILESKVVRDPELLTQEVEDVEEALEMESESFAAVDRKSRDLHVKIDTLEKVKDEIEKVYKSFSNPEEQLAKIEELEATSEALADKNAQVQLQGKDSSVKVEQLKRHYNNIQEKISKILKQSDMRVADTNCTLENMSGEMEALKEKGDQVDNAIACLKKSIVDVQAEEEQVGADLQAEYAAFYDLVGEYHNRLIQSMTEAV
eukprot:Nk52_evm16s1073 gene=Nk52_evmTU16s1073